MSNIQVWRNMAGDILQVEYTPQEGGLVEAAKQAYVTGEIDEVLMEELIEWSVQREDRLGRVH